MVSNWALQVEWGVLNFMALNHVMNTVVTWLFLFSTCLITPHMLFQYFPNYSSPITVNIQLANILSHHQSQGLLKARMPLPLKRWGGWWCCGQHQPRASDRLYAFLCTRYLLSIIWIFLKCLTYSSFWLSFHPGLRGGAKCPSVLSSYLSFTPQKSDTLILVAYENHLQGLLTHQCPDHTPRHLNPNLWGRIQHLKPHWWFQGSGRTANHSQGS